MPRVELAGADIDFDVTGSEGPCVVQLHGLTSSRARDAKIGLDLAESLTDCRVVRYDARGHGRSSGTQQERDYGWDRLAGDLLSLLDYAVPGEKVHGVGPSMGTATLLHAAVREPSRFASLTLMAPPTAWHSRRAQADEYRAKANLVEQEGIGAFIELGNAAPAPPALANVPHTLPEIPSELLPTVLRGAAAADLPGKSEIAHLEIPTLILTWTQDPTHPRLTATTLNALISTSRLITAGSPKDLMTWSQLLAEHVRAT